MLGSILPISNTLRRDVFPRQRPAGRLHPPGYTQAVATFDVERFERQAEAFVRARSARRWRHAVGEAPTLGLGSLYEQDFPSFTSHELYADLLDAPIEDANQRRRLQALLAGALLEGRTRDLAGRAARLTATLTVEREPQELSWRGAPMAWTLAADVSTRHAIQESWLHETGAELNPALQRWQEALLAELPALGGQSWSAYWSTWLGYPVDAAPELARQVLDATADTYHATLKAFFDQLELPVDDAWTADADWAFRAPRFDLSFPTRTLMQTLTRGLRDLSVDLTAQPGLRLDLDQRPGKLADVACVALDVPNEVGVSYRPIGGYLDYERLLRGIGQAQHLLHTDRTLPFASRWLGDPSTTLGYGVLLEGLLREPRWLESNVDLPAPYDFLVIAHLGWMHRVRRAAAGTLYDRALWSPDGATAGDHADTLGAALRLRAFPEERLLPLLDCVWQPLQADAELRAEVFAAQLRRYLRTEYDEEWFRSPRAARFIREELWRPGRRHSADELLRFMGYAGFDPRILCSEIVEVLKPV